MKQAKAYKYIKKKILNRYWSTDQAIDVNRISNELNISRTPINKALRKLEHEGYLKIIPQVGVFVKEPDEQEVYEKMLVSSTLDALTTSQAALKITNDQLDYLQQLLYKMEDANLSFQEYRKLNVEFHTTIIHASELHHIIKISKELWDYLNYVTNPSDLFTGESREESQAEHWMLYFSLRRRDAELARRVMEKHMDRVINSAMRNFRGPKTTV